MPKLTKTYRIEESCLNKTKAVADSEFDGNFTAALESLINQACLLRELDIQQRHVMYDSVKSECYPDPGNVRNLIDALHI